MDVMTAHRGKNQENRRGKEGWPEQAVWAGYGFASFPDTHKRKYVNATAPHRRIEHLANKALSSSEEGLECLINRGAADRARLHLSTARHAQSHVAARPQEAITRPLQTDAAHGLL